MTSSRWNQFADQPEHQPVEFEADCNADEVYLLLKSPTTSLLMQLDRTSPDHFALTLQLSPAVYRYRYYVSRDGVTTYAAPSDHASVTMHGLDGLLTVHPHAAESMFAARGQGVGSRGNGKNYEEVISE